MRRGLALACLAALTPGCQLMGFYDDPPTACPDEVVCCFTGDPLAHRGCDWTCNDPRAPDFVLTALRPEADRPSAPAFRSALEDGVASGRLSWLFDIGAENSQTTFRTGSGICDQPGVCSFAGEPAPAEGVGNLAREGRLSLPTAGTFDVTIRVDTADLGRWFDLPLHECTFTGPTQSDGNCIGQALTTRPGDWSATGQLACEISANEAKEIDLSALNRTLCDELAGFRDSDSCMREHESTWPNEPDEDINGFPSWRLQAQVAAIGVRIEP